MFLLSPLLLLPLVSCSPSTTPEKGAASAVQAWPAVPRGLAASDENRLKEALAAASTTLAARPIPSPPGGGAADDIVVIVLDTVRADRLGVYGYARNTSPKLDAWAAGARVWERAWTDGPWTLPAHASMFTGLAQRTHAARSVGREDKRKGAPLAASHTTIAERLAAGGYTTVAVTANRAFLHPSYGLSQGFDVWINDQLDEDPRGTPYTPADRIVPLARAALAHPDPHPRFLFVNLMDAHSPYITREGYVRDPGVLRPKTIPGRGASFDKVSHKLMMGGEIAAGIRESWSEAYDAELRFLDAQLGDLLADLGGVEHVFILADHGEYLGEHALVEHAKDVYEPVLHIPFLAKSARFAPGRTPELIQTHDLAWMVLEAAGLPVDPAMERTAGSASTEMFYTLKKDLDDPELGRRFDRVRRAHRVEDDKIILGTDGTQEVYDLAADPGETRVLSTIPEHLVGVDARWVAAHPIAPVVPESAGGLGPDEEALKALGYAE